MIEIRLRDDIIMYYREEYYVYYILVVIDMCMCRNTQRVIPGTVT